MTNTLYYGDNLDILKRYVKDESVDLVYLDPPFKSSQNYNILFKEQNGSRAASQIRAFEDTWTWDQEDEAMFAELVTAGGRVADVMRAFHTFLGPCDMMAYLVMMCPRLVELRRVMKPTASIYLHCDPAASHYLKMLMDAIFRPVGFLDEIIWRRSPFVGSSKARARFFPHNHDVLLMYSKGGSYTFNPDMIPYTDKYKKRFKNPDNDPRGPWQSVLLKTYSQATLARLRKENALIEGGSQLRYKFFLKDAPGGRFRDDVWADSDVNQINPMAKERLGYPTQKPQALLERIISASSNENDLVLDPFCGCGTTVAAAQALKRRWIGIDITYLAMTLIKQRLRDTFGESVQFEVIGEPVSLPDAEALAASDPYQFQWWALGLVNARPVEQKKGADKGIDGKIVFQGDKARTFETVVISVKAGTTGVAHVRDLRGVVDREKAAIGVLITMQDPTAPMKKEAVTAGFFESQTWGKKYPKIQLITVADLLAGKQIAMPPIKQVGATFKKAPKAKSKGAETIELPLPENGQ